MLWSGDRAWRQSGERRMLCGLQLPGPDNQQVPFKGKVADLDQSKVWPTGTCLGIDLSANQPTDVPVDCAAPHAMEVTGTVNLAEKFHDTLPPEPEQDTYIKDTCTRLTDAYLAPVQLRTTTLTLIYSTISLPSWSAGSHEVACSIGATLGNGGWATLLNSAKGPLLINGQPPVPPPDIPPERLTLPPIPGSPPNVASAPSAPSPASPATPTTQQRQGNQHLPNQPAAPPEPPANQAPAAPANPPAPPANPPAAPPEAPPPPPAPEAAPPPPPPAPEAPPAPPPAQPAPGG
jgi:predicted heme/steroid binding protein